MESTTEARGNVWCRHCKMTFVVVGRTPDAEDAMDQPELVACPYCETVRRVILPSGVAAPIIRTLRSDSGEPFDRG